jgi:putative FmdB family regulatory protein
MPTYEYECEKCKSVFEEFQSITADPLKKCTKPGCNGKVHRLFSPGAGFIFKGSGFYITDYRSENYKKGAKADSPAPSSGASAGSSSGASTGGPSGTSGSSTTGPSTKPSSKPAK